MKNDFMMAINQVCHERQLPLDIVLEAVEVALISAYKRNFSGNHVTAQIDSKSGEPLIFIEKAVVQEVQDEKNEISVADALKVNPRAEIGGLVSIESTPADFGRIAAQTAKQVILQRIREAERDALYSTYAEREGEIVNGTVHKIDPHQVTLSLGKVEAYLPRSEQIPTERYGEGQRLRAYVASVSKANRGPQIVVSRTHRNMLRRLLEVEVPEIYNGTVEIKSIAREAGYRSKVAVAALQEGVDPVGSCVGMRGTRIQNIVNELNGEKIDVVQWNPDLSYFIANSLSPARVMNVMLHDEQGKTAEVVVPDKQLSLAIGKEGQNARLAAKLTAWRIDIKSASEAAQEAVDKSRNTELIKERMSEKQELFQAVETILANREPIEFTDSELNTLSEAIEAINLAEMAINRERRAREEAAAQAAKEAAKARDILAEAELILSRSTTPIEDGVLEEDFSQDAADEVKVVAEANEEVEQVAVSASEAIKEVELISEAAVIEAIQPAEEEEAAVAEPEEVVNEPALVVTQAEVNVTKPVGEEQPVVTPKVEGLDWEDDGLDELERQREKKAAKQKKRRLVFDERLGEVVAERRRKSSRQSDDWLDYGDDD